MRIRERFQFEGPELGKRARRDVSVWKVWLGHGSDEYGNCSVFFRSSLFGVVFFWDPHYQTKYEVPDMYVPFGEDYKPIAERWYAWYMTKFES